jgi:hypothetical protein
MKTHSPRLDGKAICNRTIPLVERNTSTKPTCTACRNQIAKAIAASRGFRRAQLAGLVVLALLLWSQLAGCLGDDASPVTWRGQPVARVQLTEPQFHGYPVCPASLVDRQVGCDQDEGCPAGQACVPTDRCLDPQTQALWTGICQAL